MKKTLLSLVILVTVAGCALDLVYPKKIQTTFDQVKSSNRYIYRQYYRIQEKRTPVQNFEKTFYKEVFSDGRFQTKVYDKIKLDVNALPIEDSIFLLTDDKIFPITVANTHVEKGKDVTNSTENIMKADSTTVSVVTGHNEYFYKVFSLEYHLNTEQLQAITHTQKLAFRYYSGIHMITVHVDNRDLELVQEWAKK